MAESRLIDAYLTELRSSVSDLDDADEIVDEAADHLACAVEAGLAPEEVLTRFGSAQLVARVFAEEAKRGAAVSTTLTRRAGVSAVVSVALITVGEAGNEIVARGALHGLAVATILAGFVAFFVGLWGIRRRHGGLGRIGQIAFWWFIISPLLAAPAMYGAGGVLAVEWLLIMSLVGVGVLRAAILPRSAVVLFTMSPLVAVAIALGMSVAGVNHTNWSYALAAPAGVGYALLGRALSREPALDAFAGGSSSDTALHA
jgi:hypothetical protein